MPYRLFTSGKGFNKVPFIAGFNLDDGSVFAPLIAVLDHSFHMPPTHDDILEGVAKLFGGGVSGGHPNRTAVQQAVETAIAAFPFASYKDTWVQTSDLVTTYFFVCGTRRSALALQRAGVPAYVYQFTFPLGTKEYNTFGVYHSSEVAYVFGDLPDQASLSPLNKTMQETFGTYWTNFAKTLNPNDGGDGRDASAVSADPPLATWPELGSSPSHTTFLNMTVPTGLETNLMAEHCAMFDELWTMTNDW